MAPMISAVEVAKHSDDKSCWVIVHGQVYDVTDFLPDHPGGSKIILKYAGKDATEEYEPIHPPGTLEENLAKDKCLGPVDPATVKEEEVKKPTGEEKAKDAIPPLDLCLNLFDFEVVARSVLKGNAWAYYSSGADDEITMRENNTAFGRIWFRPRILRDVSTINYSTSLLGCKSTMPIYITATALGKLGHPEGEKNLTVAAGREGLIQMIPTLASCSFDEIVDARLDEQQSQFFQLYVNSNRAVTERIIRKAEDRGIKALFITVDAPQLGRREKDMRLKYESDESQAQKDSKDKVDRSQGAARAISSFIDPSLNWDDLVWLRGVTRLPVVLKGVQTWEDALRAKEIGLAGVVLSNHGGRQLDYARSGIEVLGEVSAALKSRGYTVPDPAFQIFVDGGVRRATDVLKAVAMGATACGIGRPFLYAYSAYGPDGVQRAIQLLKEEMTMNMRLLGAPSLKDVVPEMVDTRGLSMHTSNVPSSAGEHIYERLANASGKPPVNL